MHRKRPRKRAVRLTDIAQSVLATLENVVTTCRRFADEYTDAMSESDEGANYVVEV